MGWQGATGVRRGSSAIGLVVMLMGAMACSEAGGNPARTSGGQASSRAPTFPDTAGVAGMGAPTVGAPAPGPTPETDGPPVMPPDPGPACDSTSVDSDGDSFPDCMDGCPADPQKFFAGVCGCAVADTDTDGDGTPDCLDGCPADPASAPAVGSECASGMGADAGNNPGPSNGACPPGFDSPLALVLTGASVPGNLELGLASAPETPRNPCGLPQEQDCFTRLNGERAAAGRSPLLWDGDLVDLARSHAADRSQRAYPGSQHGSSTNTEHLYQERAAALGLKSGKFTSVVENAVKGASTAEAAVGSWMGSPGHRAVVLGDGAWAMFTHAGCGNDGREWNIEFGQ